MFRQRSSLGWVRPHRIRTISGEAVTTGQADTTHEEQSRLDRSTAWLMLIVFSLGLPTVIITQIIQHYGRVQP